MRIVDTFVLSVCTKVSLHFLVLLQNAHSDVGFGAD